MLIALVPTAKIEHQYPLSRSRNEGYEVEVNEVFRERQALEEFW